MYGNRITYVVDTNVIVDYVGIIPGILERQPEEPTIDLSHAHIVIPTAVIRELSSFKKEKTDRGKAARIALKRIREIAEGRIHNLEEIYNLRSPITIGEQDQEISILPVHKNFKKCLPFSPSEDDMDGQIILATLTARFVANNMPIDGTADMELVMSYPCTDDIILLTNDNGLAIRARERGIQTQRYGYKYPDPYTGRRNVVVPEILFDFFKEEGKISHSDWTSYMPHQSPLVANEFIVMQRESGTNGNPRYTYDADEYFSHIGRYDMEQDAIVRLQHVCDFPLHLENDGQAIYAEALMHPDISAIICTGPAGSGKTFMATIYGYNACKAGEYIGVTVVPCESHSELGALPGDINEKMDPEVRPIKNALRNYLLKNDRTMKEGLRNLRRNGGNAQMKHPWSSRIGSDEGEPSLKQKLDDKIDAIWNAWFTNVPIPNARGRDFAYELAIYDEFQDQNAIQADTLIKRIGTDGKIIMTGDVHQVHNSYLDETNNGLVYASRMLYDEPTVAQVCFTEDEVVRHPLVKEIARRQKETAKTKTRPTA